MAGLSFAGQSKQRQIVILAVGGVLLGGLLLFQVPRTLKMLNPPSPATATEPAPPPVTPTPGAGPAPAPVSPVGETPPAGALPSPARFKSKDPFIQQVDPSGGGAGTTVDGETPASFTPVGTAKTGAAPDEEATIAVNGVAEKVSVSAAFPDDSPVFKLVSLSGNTAKIGIAGGSLKGGSPTVTLTRGEPLTLLNTVDGKRYKLELK